MEIISISSFHRENNDKKKKSKLTGFVICDNRIDINWYFADANGVLDLTPKVLDLFN